MSTTRSEYIIPCQSMEHNLAPPPESITKNDRIKKENMKKQLALYDIDGDGTIDEVEFFMSGHQLQNVSGRDFNHDGVVSSTEERQSRILEGRRQLVKDFITRNRDRMWLYGDEYKGLSHKETFTFLIDSHQFAPTLKGLLMTEKRLNGHSSQRVRDLINPPFEDRSNPHTIGYETARRNHEEQLARCYRQRREEMKNTTNFHNRVKGNTPGYGGFAHFAACLNRHEGGC